MIYELKIDEETFKGFAKVEIPKFAERMQIAKESEIKDGDTISALDKLVKFSEVAKKYTKEIDLKCGDVTVSSLDDLENYQEGMAVVYKIAGLILNGIPLGNSQQR